MAGICYRCGNEVEFRRIDGQNRPLGCGCSGEWGGFGYSNNRPRSDPSAGGARARVRTIHRYRGSDEFYRPSRCPICRAEVYFVRHNGGSVWFDELGWPWPKHACFDLPNTRRTHERIDRFSQKYQSLTIGLISEVEPDPENQGAWITFARMDGTTHRGYVRSEVAVHELLGELVAFSWADCKMFRVIGLVGQIIAFEHAEEVPSQRANLPCRTIQSKPPTGRFRDGDTVEHATFGVGTVVATRRSGDDTVVEVLFATAGLRALLLGMANLMPFVEPEPQPPSQASPEPTRVRVYFSTDEVLVKGGVAVGKRKNGDSTIWTVIPDGERGPREFVSPPCVVKRLRPKGDKTAV